MIPKHRPPSRSRSTSSNAHTCGHRITATAYAPLQPSHHTDRTLRHLYENRFPPVFMRSEKTQYSYRMALPGLEHHKVLLAHLWYHPLVSRSSNDPLSGAARLNKAELAPRYVAFLLTLLRSQLLLKKETKDTVLFCTAWEWSYMGLLLWICLDEGWIVSSLLKLAREIARARLFESYEVVAPHLTCEKGPIEQG